MCKKFCTRMISVEDESTLFSTFQRCSQGTETSGQSSTGTVPPTHPARNETKLFIRVPNSCKVPILVHPTNLTKEAQQGRQQQGEGPVMLLMEMTFLKQFLTHPANNDSNNKHDRERNARGLGFTIIIKERIRIDSIQYLTDISCWS